MITLVAPLTGPVIPLEAAPDAVFSQRVLGDGVAIEPLSGMLLAPCDGVVTQLHEHGHALTLTSQDGAEILLHIGIDTVSLEGRGFTPKVAEGARVRTGDALVAFDADAIARVAPCLQTMVIVVNGDRFEVVWRAGGRLEAGWSRLMTLRSREEAQDAALVGAGVSHAAQAIIAHGGGLHARPAALVRAAAQPFAAEVLVRSGDREAQVASVVSLMGLGIHEGERVTVHGRGADAVAAVTAVVKALETPLPHPKEAGPPPMRADHADGRGLRGVCASPGVAVGRVVRVDAGVPDVMERGVGVEIERGRLRAALARVGAELAHAVRMAEVRGAAAERSILQAHQALLEDPAIVVGAERAVAAGHSAGFAFRQAVAGQCDVLAATGDSRLAERASDLRDLERRVLRAASNEAPRPLDVPPGSIVVADDLGPSDLLHVRRDRLAGLATARGGATSHVAVLARAFGIPALVAVGPELLGVRSGTGILLDADAGRIDPAPDPSSVARARQRMIDRAARRAEAGAAAAAPAMTLDGERVEVAANIATVKDAEEAVAAGADGVGLLRSELLFLDRREAPSMGDQLIAYQAIVDALDGRSAIIRTLDAGNDKELPFLPRAPEANPALGLRGVRLDLVRPDLLETQLEAILGVEPPGAIRILLPMVSDVTELVRVRGRLDALAKKLSLAEAPELGVMIEVPSAALLADQLAEQADFFSVGTNDLTQYALAMDRTNPELAPLIDGLHPAVLRLIEKTVAGAERHGKGVGVCGALASDLEAIPVLVGLGVVELSVSPDSIAEVKARVRGLEHAVCRREAARLLELASAAAVRARARELWP